MRRTPSPSMKRTTVMLDEEIIARLRDIARRRGTTSSWLIREAIGSYVAASGAAEGSPLVALTGLFSWREGDAASDVEAAFGEAVEAKFERIRRDHDDR